MIAFILFFSSLNIKNIFMVFFKQKICDINIFLKM
ncbi:hypothetical protein HDEF_0244 [Candidatus Hamiltonella defensa 5AT (Acyrthosiphon pisum)]|uniref:Uncharacterized protein n=1 Tax=Hamiltonella defensa subsp. Acyrthosiphon pisum (strain 5AT) TaxID=572265 RepID=C4K369_HAMD5|nr:hypothetical protein HDEF_0244 [Candidatus Hamiltonella defensa 5AT (Acyrthosiphon pisum)]